MALSDYEPPVVLSRRDAAPKKKAPLSRGLAPAKPRLHPELFPTDVLLAVTLLRLHGVNCFKKCRGWRASCLLRPFGPQTPFILTRAAKRDECRGSVKRGPRRRDENRADA
jgi:hypothetical protein